MSNAVVLTEIYEGQEVFFRNENGTPEVRIDEVAKFCGWTKIERSGNEVIRWDRVNKHLVNLMHPQVGAGDFIKEYIMYPLIGKANNEKATKFMLWVGQILTQLRATGVVIMDHAKDEAIDFEKKFGKYRIRKTFSNSSNVIEDYKQFVEMSKVEWKAKRLNNKDRVKLCNIIVSALQDKISGNILTGKPSEIMQLQELITDVKTDIVKLSNKKNGGEKTAQTKLIKQLQQQLDVISPPDVDDYYMLPVHGFSHNAQYQAVSQNKMVKTPEYKAFCDYFPYYLLPSRDELGIDFNKPVRMYLMFDHIARFDTQNLVKSAVDLILGYYGQNDNIVRELDVKANKFVDTYRDGKIYFILENI